MKRRFPCTQFYLGFAIIASLVALGCRGREEATGTEARFEGFERSEKRMQVAFLTNGPASDWGYNYAARVVFDNRVPVEVFNDGCRLRFRFSPRDAKVWSYIMHSDFPDLDGRVGRFTAVSPGPAKVRQVSRRHPRWWTDDQDPALAEGIHAGARTVSRWRVEFLSDFAARLQRLAVPEAKPSRSEGRP